MNELFLNSKYTQARYSHFLLNEVISELISLEIDIQQRTWLTIEKKPLNTTQTSFGLTGASLVLGSLRWEIDGFIDIRPALCSGIPGGAIKPSIIQPI
jgi:hypothetical protein